MENRLKMDSRFDCLKCSKLVTRGNQLTQKSMTKSLNTSVTTINKIINKYLQLIKVKKHKVHRLSPSHAAQCKTFPVFTVQDPLMLTI